MAKKIPIPIHPADLKDQEHPSTCFVELHYDEESMQMTAVFQNRGTYVYFDFPPDVAADWNTSGSRGIYFNLYIKDHGYEYERIA